VCQVKKWMGDNMEAGTLMLTSKLATAGQSIATIKKLVLTT